MKRIFGLIMFIPLILKAGALYYYVDENGVYHFSDQRTNEKYNKVMIWSDKNLPGIKKELNINFDLYIKEACEYYGVDKDLIRAMIKVESDYDPYAVSKKGAQGLMQLMPETARQFRLFFNSSVARCAVKLFYFRALCQLPAESMLSASTAHNQYFHNFLQSGFFPILKTLSEGSSGKKSNHLIFNSILG